MLSLDIQFSVADFSLCLSQQLPLSGVVGVLGPSGSGKSTLLRVLAGLEAGAEGRICFDDQVWLDTHAKRFLAPHRRAIGYVFQEANLFHHLDVAGNLAFGHRRARVSTHRPDLEAVIDALELGGLLKRSPATLSGGERQRVAIGRAIINNPRLMLMDEPLSAIDYERRSELIPYLRAVIEQFGIPMLYVSHELDELAALADRLLVMRAGRCVAYGATFDVMRRLDLGEVSGAREAGAVLEARVEDHDAVFHLTTLICGNQRLSVPRFAASTGDSVRLRVHARDVALALVEPKGLSIRNVLNAVVAEVAEQADGPSADVLLDIGGQFLRARITRASLAELGLRVNDRVYALVKTASVESD